jgi:DNA repair exonuclease SbcCD ATPase subunit
MGINYVEEEKKKLKEIKEHVEEINQRLQYLLGDVGRLKSTSTELWNELKVKNRSKHKQSFEEIEKFLKKIDEIVIHGPLDEIVSDMADLESGEDSDRFKKASLSNLIGQISKKLYEIM